MVKVQLFRNQDGQVLSFIASGHADEPDWDMEVDMESEGDLEDEMSDTVYDLVCAAVSAVTQTALLGLGEYVGLEGRLTYNIDEDGWLYCKLPQELTPEERMRADAILETMLIGLKSIESSYDDKIKVEEEVE